jgi:excisionase family DNA binding protein
MPKQPYSAVSSLNHEKEHERPNLNANHFESYEPPLTLHQAAGWLSVTEPTARRFIRAGHLRATKVGGQWRVSRSDILLFLKETSLSRAMREYLLNK